MLMMLTTRECDSKRRKFKGSFASYDFLAQTVQTVRRPIKFVRGILTQHDLKIFAKNLKKKKYMDKLMQAEQNQVIDTVSDLSRASCPASARQQRMKRLALTFYLWSILSF